MKKCFLEVLVCVFFVSSGPSYLGFLLLLSYLSLVFSFGHVDLKTPPNFGKKRGK